MSNSTFPDAVIRGLILLMCLTLGACRASGPAEAHMAKKWGDGQTRVLTDTDGSQYAVTWFTGGVYTVQPLANAPAK